MDTIMYNELVKGILEALGNQTVSIILYGSTARGTNSPDSDVDIAVIIHGELSSLTEDSLSDFVVDMNLKYDRVFSVIDIDDELFNTWENVTPFYKNVKKDGIVLWKAA